MSNRVQIEASPLDLSIRGSLVNFERFFHSRIDLGVDK